MASYSCKIVAHSRKQNKNSIALASYRSGEKLEDLKNNEIHNQRKEHKSEVLHSEIIGFSGSRNELWNAAENAEKRKDAVVMREIVGALPHEISNEKRVKICRKMAENLNKKYGCAVDFAIHAPDEKGDSRNYHAHISFTSRAVENGVFAKKKYRNLDKNSNEIREIRKLFADIQNEYLDDNKVSHLSCEAQGKDKKYERIGFHSYHQNRENNDLKEFKLQSNILRFKRDEIWETQQELYQISKDLYEQSQQNYQEKSKYISLVKKINYDLKRDFENAQNLKRQLANVYEDRQRIDEQFTILRSEKIKSNWKEKHQAAKNQTNETINILKVEQKKQNLIIQTKLSTKIKVQGLVDKIKKEDIKVNEIKQIITEKRAVLKDKYSLYSNAIKQNKIAKNDIKTAINNEKVNPNYLLNQQTERENEQIYQEQRTKKANSRLLEYEENIDREDNRIYEDSESIRIIEEYNSYTGGYTKYLESEYSTIEKRIGISRSKEFDFTNEIKELESKIEGIGERRTERNNELKERIAEQKERIKNITEFNLANSECIVIIKKIEPDIAKVSIEKQTEFSNNKLNYIKQIQGITTEETPEEIKELQKATNDFVKIFNTILSLINKVKIETDNARIAEQKLKKEKENEQIYQEQQTKKANSRLLEFKKTEQNIEKRTKKANSRLLEFKDRIKKNQAIINKIDELTDKVKQDGSEENIKSRVEYIYSLSDNHLKGYISLNRFDIDENIPLKKQVKDISLQKANDKLRSQTATVAKNKGIKI